MNYLILTGLGHVDHGSKVHPDIGNYSACKSHSIPLKSFKGMFAAANHHANNLRKTGTSKKEQMTDLKNVNLKW